MANKQNCEKNTPPKCALQNVHDRIAHSTFNSDSPFTFLTTLSTPPSRFARTINPFEPLLTERLHTHFFSPSVFSKESRLNSTQEKFKWSIDDISSFNPADIDETSVEQFFTAEHDPVVESFAQAKIDKFFKSKEIVPSPFNQEIKPLKLISDSASPINEKCPKRDGVCQTVLSLPPVLPLEVEEILKPYFSYNENQQQNQNSNQSLYKKLFVYEDRSPDSVNTSPARSIVLSPFHSKITVHNRHYESVDCEDKFNDCDLSPINISSCHIARERKSATRLDFSAHMSIDNSCNIVPDTLNLRDESLSLDRTKSPVLEVMSNSTINWDMEYKQIHLVSPTSKDSSSNEMDVSNSNTPRSKIFLSQKKKLSDSFLNYCDNELDNGNTEDVDMLQRNENIDSGYQTSCVFSEDVAWNKTQLFASTPTKVKH